MMSRSEEGEGSNFVTGGGKCQCDVMLRNTCYSSVKYKSNSLNCSTKIIKSAPKLNRSTCANKHKVYKVSIH